ncbi:hypothetical protein [Flavobacterium sp.]|uniref:hypothetical protein n=1 Tax=Flavobacterium sp. TaxID=239 RepID=UPI00375097B5
MESNLVLMEVEILFLFSLKRKRLQSTAGIWITKMRKPFAPDSETSSELIYIFVI